MLAVAGGYVSLLTVHDEETNSYSLFVMTSVQFISFSACNRQPESTDTIYTADLKVQVADNSSRSTQLGSSPLVTLDFPSALSPRVINALKADPNTVDLRAQAPHFYALGARILELFEEEEIVDVLLEVR
jgi:hypothetical protein